MATVLDSPMTYMYISDVFVVFYY